MPYVTIPGYGDVYATTEKDLPAMINAVSGGLASAATAGFTNTRAGLAPAESRADIAKAMADAAQARANAGYIGEQTRFVGPLAGAEIGVKGAQATSLLSDANANNGLAMARYRLGLAADGSGRNIAPYAPLGARPAFGAPSVTPREPAGDNRSGFGLQIGDAFRFRTIGGGF